ncbi:MAG: hypothetical protein OXI87_01610 [Albidovulum sp.]|nr:hypothetical protein [Albidovulum sp.]
MVHDNSDPLRSVFTTRRTCSPNTMLVSVPYRDHKEVDVRADERDARIRDCAARRSLASHGNVSCESDG